MKDKRPACPEFVSNTTPLSHSLRGWSRVKQSKGAVTAVLLWFTLRRCAQASDGGQRRQTAFAGADLEFTVTGCMTREQNA